VSASIHNHIRNNAIAYVALFVALTGGTAYALDGSNTVFTDDIVDGEVRSADINNGAVTTEDLSNSNGVRSEDVRDDTQSGGGLAASDLGPASVGQSEVANGSLTGAEFADRSIGGQKIGNETLSGANVTDGALFGADIANDSLGAADIGTSAVAAGELNPDAFVQADIARASATNQRYGVADDAIQGSEVSARTLTGSDVVADSLTGAEVKEPTLDTPEAAYYTVTPGIAVPWTTPDPSSPDLRTVAARRVEPGTYVVMAKAEVVGDGPSSVHCFLLVNGSEVDSAGAHLDGDGFAGGSLAMLGFAGTATSSIDLAVRCSRIGADEVRVSYRRLVAVKVNRLIGADAG
jgi:hypothetical protein